MFQQVDLRPEAQNISGKIGNQPLAGVPSIRISAARRADPKVLSAKFPELIDRYMGAEIARTNAYHLQPLNRIYLYSRQDYNLDWYGDIDRVYQFGLLQFWCLQLGVLISQI